MSDPIQRSGTGVAGHGGREAWLQAIFDNANDAILLYHLDEDNNPLQYIEANAAAVQLYGYSRDELLQLTPRDLIDPSKDYRVLAAKILSDGADVVPSLHVTKDGRRLRVDVSAHRFVLDGQPAVLTIGRDMTERRSAQEQLAAANARLAQVLEATHDHFMTLDRAWRFTYLNRRLADLIGKRVDELLGRVVWDVFPEWKDSETHREYQRAVEERRPIQVSAFSVLTQRWVEADAYPTDDGLLIVGRDVTDRKGAADALRRTAETLALAQQIAGLGSWEIEWATMRLTCSEQMYRLLGYEPGTLDLTVQAIVEMVPPEDRPMLRRSFEAAVRDRTIYHVDHRLVRADGELRHVSEHAFIEFDNAGEPTRVVGTMLDITDRVRAAEAVREMDRRFRAFAEHMHDVLWITDAAMQRLIYASPSFEAVYGCPVEPVYEDLERGYACIHPDDVAKVRSRAMAPPSRPIVTEYRVVHPDGRVITIRDRCFAIRDERGQPLYFAGISEDVTEQNRAAQALRESEERLRIALDAARLGSWESNPATGEFHCSDLCKINFGFPEDADVDADMMMSRILPEDREAVIAADRRAIQAADEFEIEYRVAWPDGSLHWMLTRGRILGEADAPRMIGVTLDITTRKQAIEDLRRLNETLEQRVAERTAEAEQRAAQLRELALQLTRAEQEARRRLAHTLHDGLQQLLVAAKLRLDTMRPLPAPDSDAVTRAAALIAQAVEMSRSLTLELSPPVLHDRGFEAGLHWLVRWMEEHHGLAVDVRMEPGAEPESDQVRVLLFEVARELLFNVVKHAGVNRAEVQVHAVEHTSDVRMIVSDTGAGFAAEAQGGGGTRGGFGLVSIHERLGFLGGRLEVHSEPGRGTRAAVTFPRGGNAGPSGLETDVPLATHAHHAATPQLDVAGGTPASIRVLLADDHKILRDGLASLLSDQDDIDIVGEASDGVMAVEMAHELQPDVIVMDITMPRLSGIEATRRIKADLPNVRIIGLSMHTAEDMAAALREAGAEAYLTKGGPAEDLVDAIRGG